MSSWLVPGFNFHCAPVDASDNPSSLRVNYLGVHFSYLVIVVSFVFTLKCDSSNYYIPCSACAYMYN